LKNKTIKARVIPKPPKKIIISPHDKNSIDLKVAKEVLILFV
jgi:hypothetical protein